MKALIYEQHGGPEVLQYQDAPDPEPGPRDVVIKVAATTINHLDAAQRNGWFTIPGFSLPHISGMDVVGTVTETGSGVTRVKPGDRVLVNPSMFRSPRGLEADGYGRSVRHSRRHRRQRCRWLRGKMSGAGNSPVSCSRRHVMAPCRRLPHLLDDRASRPVRDRPAQGRRDGADPRRGQRRVRCRHSMGQAGGSHGPGYCRQWNKMFKSV